MDIRDLVPGDERAIEQAAAVLIAAFVEHEPEAWPTLEAALDEVRESLEPGRLCLVACEDGEVVGWVGAIAQYRGRVWEIHPLAVHPRRQGKGLGRALVTDIERRVHARGGSTLLVGTDDTDGRTTLSGVDLYPDPWPHVAAIKNLGRHPYEFYQRLGFVITGVVPDANGPGTPDILLAKRVGR